MMLKQPPGDHVLGDLGPESAAILVPSGDLTVVLGMMSLVTLR